MSPSPTAPRPSVGARLAGAMVLALAAASPPPAAATIIPPADFRDPEFQLRSHSWEVWARVLHAVRLADRFGRPIRVGSSWVVYIPPQAERGPGGFSIMEYRQAAGRDDAVIARIENISMYPGRPAPNIDTLRLSLVRITVPVASDPATGLPSGPLGQWAREQFDQPAIDAAYREAGCTTGYGPCRDYVAPPIDSPEWHALRNWIEVETYYADTCPGLGTAMSSLARIAGVGLVLDPAAQVGLGGLPHYRGRPDNEAGPTGQFDTLILSGVDPAGNAVRYHTMRGFGADSTNPVELAWQAIQSVRVACTATYKGPPVMPPGFVVPALPADR